MQLCHGIAHGGAFCDCSLLFLQKWFVPDGVLQDFDSSQNARFGYAISAVPDLNQDSFNDVVIGAPLEDDHKGAIYIFHGFKKNILKKYKQVRTKRYTMVLLEFNFTQLY